MTRSIPRVGAPACRVLGLTLGLAASSGVAAMQGCGCNAPDPYVIDLALSQRLPPGAYRLQIDAGFDTAVAELSVDAAGRGTLVSLDDPWLAVRIDGEAPIEAPGSIRFRFGVELSDTTTIMLFRGDDTLGALAFDMVTFEDRDEGVCIDDVTRYAAPTLEVSS